ncbi:hypothetical protein GCM10027296_27510 [Chitinimonas naiadis]
MRSLLLAVCLYLAVFSHAASHALPDGWADDDAALAAAMPALAEQVLADYRDDDRSAYLDQLFRLQLLTRRYPEAMASTARLREVRADGPYPAAALNVPYQIDALAQQAASQGQPFELAYAAAFRSVMQTLDDATAAMVIRALQLGAAGADADWRSGLAGAKGKTSLEEDEALALLRQYQASSALRRAAPWLDGLVAEDDQRRYLIEREVAVPTAPGVVVCALIVRPRSAVAPLPTLLNFTIYASPESMLVEARRTASHGYAAVVGLSRGKGCSPGPAVPYEHDGEDAAALIEWIAVQGWSDGRVGMYGGSYEGFTQWAAAKRLPRALKAMMPSVTAAPGIDVPMDGNVFFSFVYYWPFYITNNKTQDEAAINDRARWARMWRNWYVGGTAYRDLDQIDGTPNPIFRRWLAHPAYDAYWQAMIPYRQEFARIDIPILTTTGYYDDGQLGALYYYQQHLAHRPNAEHYLLIGPYDHVRGQRGTMGPLGDARSYLRGYRTDAVAQIDIGELRYQWFDHILRGGPKPALLQDKVNYQLMGGNVWRHAPSIDAMGMPVRLYLSDTREGGRYLLRKAPTRLAPITQTMALADRRDIDRAAVGGGIVNTELDTWGSMVWVSPAFTQATELSGLFKVHLDFSSNKRDLDLRFSLYELTAAGEYVELSSLQNRLSYARDRSQRQLLVPGKRQQLELTAGRLTSRLLAKGSRLVVLAGVIKQPQMQINYGSGKDVSDETVADGKVPVRLRWYGGTGLTLPLRPAG